MLCSSKAEIRTLAQKGGVFRFEAVRQQDLWGALTLRVTELMAKRDVLGTTIPTVRERAFGQSLD